MSGKIRLDTKLLKWYCKAHFNDLALAVGGEVVNTKLGRYIFRDNDATILMVAHARYRQYC